MQQPLQRHAYHAPCNKHAGYLLLHSFPQTSELPQGLPPPLYRLLDPQAPVELPPCGASGQALAPLDNRELDKLVAGLGRSKATWRRALMLHQWLQVGNVASFLNIVSTRHRKAQQGNATAWQPLLPASAGVVLCNCSLSGLHRACASAP